MKAIQANIIPALLLIGFLCFNVAEARFNRLRRQTVLTSGSAVPAAVAPVGTPLSSNYNGYSPYNSNYGRAYGNSVGYSGGGGTAGGLIPLGLSAGQMGVAADAISLGGHNIDMVAAAGRK